jgi:hypothetical protein
MGTLSCDLICLILSPSVNGGLPIRIHSIFRDPISGRRHDNTRPNMDVHTYTGNTIKTRLKGVPRGVACIEKVKCKNRQSKGMKPDRAYEAVS